MCFIGGDGELHRGTGMSSRLEFRGRQKGETELREGLGEIDGRSEPFLLKLHSLLLEGVFMVGILSLKGDRKR